MWDVAVAGAGPAGSIAALVLARSGCRVVLADGEDTHSHKVGESLPAAAVRLLHTLGVQTPEQAGGHLPIGGNLSCWGSAELTYRDFLFEPEGVGWRLDRRRFDTGLRDAAVAAGAVRVPSRLIAARRDRHAWGMRFGDGREFGARWVIDAGGRRTELLREFGAARKQDVPLVALYALANLKQPASLNRTVVEATAEGWWYAACLPSGQLLVGLHVSPNSARRIAKAPDAWSALWRKTRYVSPLFGEATFTERLAPLNASGGRLDRFTGQGWLCCGDAALTFDPLSSLGILTAIYGGMLAGNMVLKSLGNESSIDAEYNERLNSIRLAYRVNLLRAYRQERRWPRKSFWQMHQEPSMTK